MSVNTGALYLLFDLVHLAGGVTRQDIERITTTSAVSSNAAALIGSTLPVLGHSWQQARGGS